jgi:hypothetical protein
MAYLHFGPGDLLGPNFGHPNDPRNDPDDFEELSPEQERKEADEAAHAKWESCQ